MCVLGGVGVQHRIGEVKEVFLMGGGGGGRGQQKAGWRPAVGSQHVFLLLWTVEYEGENMPPFNHHHKAVQ